MTCKNHPTRGFLSGGPSHPHSFQNLSTSKLLQYHTLAHFAKPKTMTSSLRQLKYRPFRKTPLHTKTRAFFQPPSEPSGRTRFWTTTHVPRPSGTVRARSPPPKVLQVLRPRHLRCPKGLGPAEVGRWKGSKTNVSLFIFSQ